MTEYVLVPIASIPIALAVVFGMLSELEVLAYEVSDRTIEYADDAVRALDCAYEARPLTDCSPNLINPDFSAEIERTQQQIQALKPVHPSADQHDNGQQ